MIINRHKGFTYIEVLVVLTVMAIISAIAFPAYKKYQTEKDLEAFCETFEHDLKLAKQIARSTGGAIITFYRVPEDITKPNYPIRYSYFEIKDGTGALHKKSFISDRVGIEGVPLSNYIVYRTNGALSVDHTANIVITLTSKGCKKYGQLTINKDTGAVDLVYK